MPYAVRACRLPLVRCTSPGAIASLATGTRRRTSRSNIAHTTCLLALSSEISSEFNAGPYTLLDEPHFCAYFP